MSICRILTWLLLPLIATSCLAQPSTQKPEIIHDLVEEPVLTRPLKTYTEPERFFLAGTLCFISASISSAGGIGGGGLYIPILIMVVGLDLKTASSFSAFMVTGASVANVACSLFDTNPGPGKKSLIDFDITLLSEPCMLLGVSVGVICNVVFPEWLITSMFALFLAWTTYKTFRIGVTYWRKESGEKRRNGDQNTECLLQRDEGNDKGEGNGDSELPVLVSYENSSSKRVPWGKLGELVIIWMSFSFVYLLRGNKYGESIIQIKPCGVAYWALSSLQVPLAIIITAWVIYSQKSRSDQNLSQQEMEAPNKDMLSGNHVFPTMAMLAGTIGGVFGIGGGTLISPLLLQIGIPPEVTGATCSLIVLFSSTMSAFQYLLLGMKNMKTAAIFAVICFLGSLIGLVAVKRAIKKHGRASLIIFSVGTVMALSTALLSGLGVMNVWRDYKVGKYMGFNLPC